MLTRRYSSMIIKRFSVVLPILFLTALIITNGCAKRISTSQLDETGTTDRSAETTKPGAINGEDVIAIAEPSIPSVDVYEEESEGESTLSTVSYKGIKDIYFDFDRYTISADSRPVLQNNASVIKSKNIRKVTIEGHSDARGTNEYNLALGERRAQSTKRYLTALGINPSYISTISYGEEKPFCFEQNENCWEQNRRAHLVIQ